MTDYLTVDEVLAFHGELIERYGGSTGLRDIRQLEAALSRPRSGYCEDEIAQAAALWESLSQNHPFIDGNKRVAFAAAYSFLAINGVALTASAEETWAFLSERYESNSFRFEAIDAGLRRHVRRI